MLEHDGVDGRGAVRVVLRVPAEIGTERVQVLGDCNDWSRDIAPMERLDGEFVTTLTLPGGRIYRFRYLVDGERWANDPSADDYHPNHYGGYDSVIDLTDGRS